MDNTEKIKRLTEWINEQGQWAEDYVSHEDNINSYAELFEPYNIHYGEIDEDIQDEVKGYLEEMDAYEILDFCHEPDIHYGIRRRSDEIWSISFGEIETQLTSIYDHETKSNCVFTDLCEGLTDEEIKEACDASDHYVNDGYIYQDHSYDRVSIVLDVDRLLKHKRTYKPLYIVG